MRDTQRQLTTAWIQSARQRAETRSQAPHRILAPA